jgi:EGF-like domain
MAKCHNGGACFNGKCMCPSQFYGDFCESACIILNLMRRREQRNRMGNTNNSFPVSFNWWWSLCIYGNLRIILE